MDSYSTSQYKKHHAIAYKQPELMSPSMNSGILHISMGKETQKAKLRDIGSLSFPLNLRSI